jgi:hypothetical protein
MIDKIKKYLHTFQSWCKRQYGTKVKKHRKKASTLDKDVVLGTMEFLTARHIKEGRPVIGPHGIGFIKKIHGRSGWLTIVYSSKRVADHKVDKLKQIYFTVLDRKNDTVKVFPLSFADYKYIDYGEGTDVDIEGHITNKQYFQLTDQEKADREHLTVFNESKHSQDVLRELKEKGYSLIKIK